MGRRKTNSRSSYGLRLCALFFVLCSFCLPQLTTLCTAGAARDDSSLVSTNTPEGRLVVFDDVWETIQERYYDPKFHGIDWQAKRTAFRPAAARASGTQEFYDVLRQMITSLRDAHTRVYSPDEKFDWWSPRFVTVGLTVRDVEGAPTVIQVEPNSQAARTDIKPGDVIVKINDRPITVTGSRAMATLFEGAAGTTVKVGWTGRGGKHKSAVLERYWTQRQLGFSNQRKGKVAILRIDAFTQSVALDFSKALPDMLEGAEAIVLDLRSNGGGDAEAMADVASLFMDEGISLGKFADRSGASFELQTYSKRLWRLPRLSRVTLPLVVLTSENTSSAAEILAAALQSKGRARVIGTETCGCVLAIRNRHALPDGGVLDVSEFDYRTANGVRLEGRGVEPDKRITLTRADIYSRHDQALELAKNSF